MKQAERFFTMSTQLPFPEAHDPRTSNDLPELDNLTRLHNLGEIAAAIEYGEALCRMFPTLDAPILTLSGVYLQSGQPDQAFQAVVRGMPGCTRHYHLYEVAGALEFRREHLAEALVWWARAVVAQANVAEFHDYRPFMILAHAAQIAEAHDESHALFVMTDSIDPAKPRLDGQSIARLRALEGTWIADALVRVLKQIVHEHLK